MGLIDSVYKTSENKIRTIQDLILEFSIRQQNSKQKLNSKYPFHKNKFWKDFSLLSWKLLIPYNYISSHFLKDCNWQYPTIVVQETLILVVANQFQTCFCPRTITHTHTHTHTHTWGSVSKQDNVASNVAKQPAMLVIISRNSSPSDCRLFTSQKQ